MTGDAQNERHITAISITARWARRNEAICRAVQHHSAVLGVSVPQGRDPSPSTAKLTMAKRAIGKWLEQSFNQYMTVLVSLNESCSPKRRGDQIWVRAAGVSIAASGAAGCGDSVGIAGRGASAVHHVRVGGYGYA